MGKTSRSHTDWKGLMLMATLGMTVAGGFGGIMYMAYQSDMDKASQLETSRQSLTQAFNVNKIDVDLSTLEPGLYEMTVPTRGGDRECLVSISSGREISFTCN